MMNNYRFFRLTLWVQAIYYLITAVWPLVDIDSFMQVTGPKVDVWLVKTVAALLVPVSFCFFLHLFIRTNPWPVIILAAGCCIGLAAIDFYYVSQGRISEIYLADGIAEVLLLLAWVYIGITNMKFISQ